MTVRRADPELARRWSALHHGLDPDAIPLVASWLRFMWAGGRLLDRAGVPPNAVTATGVALAVAATRLASDRPGAAGFTVVGAALCDGLDGATAVVGGRQTRSGAVADAVADRLCDGAFAIVLRRRGASPRLAAAAAGLAWGVDALRRARRIPATVTVAERPTFTICAAVACASTAVVGRQWPARVSAAVWIGAGVVGVCQLLRTPAASTAAPRLPWAGMPPTQLPPRGPS